MSGRRAGALVVLLSLAALVAGWRTLPGSPPLYDGVCLADPYRLLGQSPAPSSATKQYPGGDSFPTSEIVTSENTPQAQLLMTDGTFVSSSPFTIGITPVQTPAPAPSGDTIDGNVYRITAVTASGTPVAPQPSHPVTVLLRATSSNPTKTMYRLDGSTWTALKTYPAGCGDTFEATSPSLGDFALLAQTGGGGGTTPGQPGGAPVVPIVLALAVVILLTIGGLFYLNRPSRR